MRDDTLSYAAPRQHLLHRIAHALWRFRRAITIAAAILLLYVGSYFTLSIFGRYEPIAIGASWIEEDGWAPAGFVHQYRWNKPLMYFYLPLWAIDVRCWHTFDASFTGKYPVDRAAKLEDVRRAWHY